MHQSQGNRDDTQVVHELGMLSIIKRTRDEIQNLKALQSKKVKLVESRGSCWGWGNLVATRTDSLLVKWDSPLGMIGSRSFLRQRWR